MVVGKDGGILNDESVNPESIVKSIISPTENPGDHAWPMQGYNRSHVGRSPYSTEDNPGVEKWQFKCDWVRGGPAIDSDGTIYFGSDEGYLYALHPNGTLKWKFKTYCGTSGWIWSTPAIAEDGTIYFGSFDDFLYALNPDGTEKWHFCAHDSIFTSPTVAQDGTIYFGTMGTGHSIYAVNPNGTEKWHYPTNGYILSAPAIADDGTVYIGSDDTYLYALYPNGTLRWRFKTENWVAGSPSIADDGTIYIGSTDGYLYALYPNNGTEKWKCDIGSTESNPSIGRDGTIYIGTTDNNNLFAINPDGTIKWSFDLGEPSWIWRSSCAISADGTIYVGAVRGDSGVGGGEIIAINSDGTLKWREIISNMDCQSSPAIGEDGTIYIGSSDDYMNEIGYLHAFGELDPNAPEAPTITGETDGRVGVEYDYTFRTVDPNGDDVCYYVEWGDGDIIDWTDAHGSGEEVVLSHAWEERGTYTIRARAKDTNNLWGPWSELEVSMPVNQQYQYPMFHWFLERFPNAFPILRHLLGL